MNFTDYAPKFTNATLQEIQRETMNDMQLQTLKTTVLNGWPDSRAEVNPSIHQYWNFREEISVFNGVLFKGHRIIIPVSMRETMLLKIHASHLGIDACTNKAKDSVYWPGIYDSITRHVNACRICQENAPVQQPLPMQTPEIPTRPWQKIAVDLFQLKGRDYLVTVDYYSDYFEIDRLYSTTSKAIINALEKHLARHGTVEVLISDNCPNLVSNEFAEFCLTWEIEHVTISPYHSQSNGKAEATVKIAKTLLKKCKQSGYNFNLTLLDYRNTPKSQIGLSPAQRMFSRRTKTLLPTSEKLLQPMVPTNVYDKIKKKRQEAKKYHDRKASDKPELVTGQSVYVRNHNNNSDKNWIPGRIQQQLTDRSYIVNAGNNCTSYRRNRVDVKPRVINEVTDPDNNSTVNANADKSNEAPRPRRSKRAREKHTPYVHIP